MNSKVLYKFKWDTCNSVYICKTKRHLLVGQYEHLGLSVFTEKPLKYRKKDATAIKKHCHQNEHRCRLDNFEIVGTAVEVKTVFVDFKNKAMFKYRRRIDAVYLFDNDS